MERDAPVDDPPAASVATDVCSSSKQKFRINYHSVCLDRLERREGVQVYVRCNESARKCRHKLRFTGASLGAFHYLRNGCCIDDCVWQCQFDSGGSMETWTPTKFRC